MEKSEKRCADCNALLVVKPRGRYPVRCEACAAARNKARKAEWEKEPKQKTRIAAYRIDQTCKQCGKVFSAKGKRSHCSAACNTAYFDSLKRKAVCKKCGIEFRPKHPRHWQYCSRGCAHADIATWYNVGKDASAERYSEVRFKKCVVCGVDFTSGSKTQQTCTSCADVLAAHNIARPKRPGKIHVRRAKDNGVPYEKFDPIAIFERDGWVCKICGISTPVSKRGTYDNDAPELDHVTPLSKGGSHSVENSQCACRRCNRHKSDAV